jgi:hypothetical protein
MTVLIGGSARAGSVRERPFPSLIRYRSSRTVAGATESALDVGKRLWAVVPACVAFRPLFMTRSRVIARQQKAVAALQARLAEKEGKGGSRGRRDVFARTSVRLALARPASC